MYAISEFIDPRAPQMPVATVDSIDAGRSYLAARYRIVCFERDQENDAADVLAAKGLMQLKQFVIERRG